MRFWLSWLAVLIGVVCLSVLFWFAFPLIAFGEARPFDPAWVRLVLIGVTFAVALTVFLVQVFRRRARRKALEAAVTEPSEPEGDARILAEKMKEAVAILKKSGRGRRTPLYELPWYVIIGRPGAGKTTALINSGLKFPLARGGTPQAVAGHGSTRHCDWWFTEDAVLIDTAGHYTTQDQNEIADRKSWQAFLELLARTRPRQPVNGVLVAISVEDLITLPQPELDRQADTLRQRLAEIQQHIKIDFPVYVVFTKADLVAGFMEYFGTFSESRRRLVWGATFRPAEKTLNMVAETPIEFDHLIAQLGEELPDRLQEEPDPRARIFAFGFPSQLAALRERITGMMNRIFEPTRYHANATLRGFYFTSGTQEGAPIDQVIGSLARRFQYDKAAALIGGHGKSFFLHDLMKKVIFAEAGWVSVNERAARRALIAKSAALAAIVLFAAGLSGLWWSSYARNETLIDQTNVAIAQYRSEGRDIVDQTAVVDTDLRRVLPLLDTVRYLPAGYAVRDLPTPIGETWGLSQRARLNVESENLYHIALERLLRSRLILRLEQQIERNIDDPAFVYEALKVYKMLGGAYKANDALIAEWMRSDWARNLFPGAADADTRRALGEHLTAMLELDEGRQPLVGVNDALMRDAERTLLRLNIVDRAYALIKSQAQAAPVEDWNAAMRGGPNVGLVFEAAGGQSLEDVRVPALFTYDGFHVLFLGQLADIEELVEGERWLLGEAADDVSVDEQYRTLRSDLLNKYSAEFIETWNVQLARLRLRRLTADKPNYTALATLASATSPLKALIESISAETALTQVAEDGETAEAGGSGGDGAAADELRRAGQRATSRLGGRAGQAARIGMRLAAKSQSRAGSDGDTGVTGQIPGENVEAHFQRYHDFVEGAPGSRPIDQFLANLKAVYENVLRIGDVDNPNLRAETSNLRVELAKLRTNATRLPAPFDAMFEQVAGDFEGDATTASIEQLNALLQREVADDCRKTVPNKYPFALDSNRDIALRDFARLFAPGGVFDRFFSTHLASLADTSGDTWHWRSDSKVASQLSPEALRSFQRAARIRDAFFEVGATPGINFEITPRSLSANVLQASLAVGRLVTIASHGSAIPSNVRWPADSNFAAIGFTPELPDRASNIRRDGPWAFFRLLDAARLSVSGNTATAQWVIGGREATYQIRADSQVNPIRLPDLASFECPRSL